MLKFLAGAFAIAGLIVAAGPIVIHLLNRRRFRVVEWGAMDFLRKAMQRSRRAVQLRDLLLLVLRCLTVALFGAALARPFVSGVSSTTLLVGAGTIAAVFLAVGLAATGILTSQSSVRRAAFPGALLCAAAVLAGLYSMLGPDATAGASALRSREPLHAIVLIDNSMSMAYESLEGTLLDRAKTRVAEFLDSLPSGSQIHIIPLCDSGSDANIAASAFRSKSDAREALDRVTPVDRVAVGTQAFDAARDAARQVPELPAKRVVLVGDQQADFWAGVSTEQLAALPDLQVMRIAADAAENVAITGFELQDGVADAETPAVFLVTVQLTGDQSLSNVQIALTVDGTEVASRLIDLEPGQLRQIEFRQRLDSVTDTGALGEGVSTATMIRATVTASVEGGVGDRLPRDNSRYLVVPVVAGLPVVFVDQAAGTEDLDRGVVGETYRLRRLLAPRVSTDEEENRQLIRIRHVSIDRLTAETLSDARLVVVAGVESPADSVPLLRQYVEQGGPLVIAAGADFDAEQWNELGWLDGAGILPVPLTGESFGQLPEVAVGTLEPFFLDTQSLQDDVFRIEGESDESLDDLYRLPLFFKAVAVDAGTEQLNALTASETVRISEQRQRATSLANVTISSANKRASDSSERFDESDTGSATSGSRHWLSWIADDRLTALAELSAGEMAERTRPRVLGRYTLEERPFLVERRVGAGRILFLTSGLYSSWNTLTATNTIVVFDRLLRRLIEDTLPERNFETGDVVPLPAEKSDLIRWQLDRPDGRTDLLAIEALSADRFGVLIRNGLFSGHYSVNSVATNANAADPTASSRPEATLLSFNCRPDESRLESLDALAFQSRFETSAARWLEADESFSVEGARISGRDLWKWLVAAVLVALLTEMTILAWPHRRSLVSEPDAQTSAA
ncbi:VWA domain-containing protein [bacterium]|nr:VWA domain-containing protein [bacterium]